MSIEDSLLLWRHVCDLQAWRSHAMLLQVGTWEELFGQLKTGRANNKIHQNYLVWSWFEFESYYGNDRSVNGCKCFGEKQNFHLEGRRLTAQCHNRKHEGDPRWREKFQSGCSESGEMEVDDEASRATRSGLDCRDTKWTARRLLASGCAESECFLGNWATISLPRKIQLHRVSSLTDPSKTLQRPSIS